MTQLLETLVRMALAKGATDIHMKCAGQKLVLSMRVQTRMEELPQDIYDASLFRYLKYRAGLDLTSPGRPQSGRLDILGFSCRFSVLRSPGMETGVLRLLPPAKAFPLEALSTREQVIRFFAEMAEKGQGLYLFAGPTGSGKTTTQHAILRRAALANRSCVSLEDPVEIPDDSYLQLEVNSQAGFTFETGIVEILRHDPDVICIGETRSKEVCARLFTAGLTGHMAISTIHAGNAKECVLRLLDLGIGPQQIETEVTAIISQRLVIQDGKKEVQYDIAEKAEIARLVRAAQ